MPYKLTDLKIDKRSEQLSVEERRLAREYARARLLKTQTQPENVKERSLPLWTHVAIISTFPLAFALLLMRSPELINWLLGLVPLAGAVGGVGLWLGRRRATPVESRALRLMLVAFGLSVSLMAPTLVVNVASGRLLPWLGAAFLYGVTLTVYLLFSIGIYGVALNLRPRYHWVGAA